MENYKLNTNPNIYDCKFEGLSPAVVGYFSVNKEPELVEDISQLRYLLKKPGNVKFDLTIGQENAKIKDRTESQETFFKYLKNHEELTKDIHGSQMENVGFVFGRSVLMTIGFIPYTYNKEVVFSAILLNGIIYLFDIKEVVPKEGRSHLNRWGKKFQQYVLSKNINAEEDTSQAVDEREEFAIVYQAKLKSHNILYRSVLHGIVANEVGLQQEISKHLDRKSIMSELENRKLAEVTTSFKKESERTFRQYKTSDIWLKCIYGRSNNIFIGFRNSRGFVNEFKRLSLKRIEELGKNHWKPNVMMNFTDTFLTYVKKCFESKLSHCDDVKNQPMTKLHFKYYSSGKIEMYDLPQGTHEYKWMPEWYIDSNIQGAYDIISMEDANIPEGSY